ncbi:hypothetical protein GJ688_07360 [Heliobacillus mobilis]|uniref:Uncharacterized protein n=1 Tax=Heliobacterium mobile TaxID=28064 RepID=A0A6I3SJN2_HELMO|nr:hypothetical protein [Heliobacterium mobile]MTV48797.1 hypothetical protein [Heliobacterium mobile]
MCTPGTFSNEIQLIIRQLKGRNHRLFHDSQDVAKYLREYRQDKIVAELLDEMTLMLKEAEKLAAKALEAVEQQQAEAEQRTMPTVTLFNPVK